jgi:hypothetical protein
MPINKKLFFAAVFCCLVCVSGLSASTITQTCTIPVTGVPYTIPCVLNDFNPAQGTLTSVVLALTGVGGNVIPEQSSTTATPLSFTGSTATIGLALVGPDSISVTDTSGPCSGTITGPGTNVTCTPSTFSGLSASSVTGTTASYIGTGTISPAFTASGQILSASGAGGPGSAGFLFFGGDGSIGGTFTLTYTYTPVGVTPEPATFFIAGGSLLLLGFGSRRWQRK